MEDQRSNLIALLQLAYSGELAAALAYRGHWHSVRSPEERAAIEKIELDEWHHRSLVGGILSDLGSGPAKKREIRASMIGHTLGFLCHVAGWLAPMWGAGRLESRNIREYETAASFAIGCGRHDLLDCLLTMAEVEWDHEAYFRGRVLSHRWASRIPIWPAPPPRESIRKNFAAALP